jgi:GntR family transcriptional regulator/MocR family aminotransferase
MSPQRFDAAITPPALVLGFGNVGERAISAGIEAIKDLL